MRSSALLWLAALMVIALAAPGESEGGPPPGPPGRTPLQALAASLWSYLARPPPPTSSAPGGSGPATTLWRQQPGRACSRTTNDNGRGGFGSQSPATTAKRHAHDATASWAHGPAGSSGPPPWRSMAPPVAKAVIPDPPAGPAPSHTAETPETTPVVDLTSAPPPPAETMNHTVDLRICKLCQKQTYAGRGQCFNKNCEPWIYNGSSFYVWAAPSK